MIFKEQQKTIEALFATIEEFEGNPIKDLKSNETLLEILSERIETVTTIMNDQKDFTIEN